MYNQKFLEAFNEANILQIGYIFSGSKVVRSGPNIARYNSGDIFCLIIGDCEVENVAQEIEGYSEYVIDLSHDELCSIMGNELLRLWHCNHHSITSRPHHAGCHAAPPLVSFFEELSTTTTTVGKLHKRLLVLLMVQFAEQQVIEWLLQRSDRRAATFTGLIYSNILNDCSLESLAAQSNCSLTSFKNTFRRHFHCSPHKWFVHRRLEYACRLLLMTTKSVAEVGIECKFENPSYFVKAFRRTYGITPQAYRRQVTTEASQMDGAKNRHITNLQSKNNK